MAFNVWWVASKADQEQAMKEGWEGEAAEFENEGELIEAGAATDYGDLVEGRWPGTYLLKWEDAGQAEPYEGVRILTHHETSLIVENAKP